MNEEEYQKEIARLEKFIEGLTQDRDAAIAALEEIKGIIKPFV